MASDPKPGEILIFKPKLVEKLQIKVDKTIRKNVKDYKKWVVKHKNRSNQEDFIPKEIDLKQAENSCYTSIDRYTKELVSVFIPLQNLSRANLSSLQSETSRNG